MKTDLWKKTAKHANSSAKYLEKGLLEKGIEIFYPVDTNAVFCIMDESKMCAITEKYDLSYWEKEKQHKCRCDDLRTTCRVGRRLEDLTLMRVSAH